MRLLLVHGRAQEGKSSQSLEQEWMQALQTGLGEARLDLPPDLNIDVPFYGDTLKGFVDRHDLPPADDIATRGGAVDDAYAQFLREVAVEARDKRVVTREELVLQGGEDVATRGPENWEWVQAVIRAIDSRVSAVSSYSIGRMLRDVFIYVNHGTVRRAINRIVAEKVSQDACVVVGHSLGSVVAYEVLREHGQCNVNRFITVGSPLGIRAIRQRLAAPLTMPKGVRDWYNAFDQRDVVALYPLDDRNFPLSPAIRNNPAVRNRTDNRHGIAGYLDDADIAKEIRTAM